MGWLGDGSHRGQVPHLSHATLTISTQIWTNYETHIFKKWEVRTPQTTHDSASEILHGPSQHVRRA